ncbi:MAG: thiopurine S-methyltransferase [Nitrosomonas sp.]|nr:thiopurine S-methyltransferase [Nitrosomonas sp.]
MIDNYWLGRWERDEIGFHQDQVNPYLVTFWETLHLPAHSSVFVPLCGKSQDMVWLQNRGHSVLGVELSELAIKTFFQENNTAPIHQTAAKFECFSADRLQILQGDFFDLEQKDLNTVAAVYDRASLVALPPETRRRYVHHITQTLPAGTQILLIGFDYPQTEMQGPPYAVSPDEIRQLYQDHADIRLLKQVDVLDDNPRFQQRGLSRLQESVFLINIRQ